MSSVYLLWSWLWIRRMCTCQDPAASVLLSHHSSIALRWRSPSSRDYCWFDCLPQVWMLHAYQGKKKIKITYKTQLSIWLGGRCRNCSTSQDSKKNANGQTWVFFFSTLVYPVRKRAWPSWYIQHLLCDKSVWRGTCTPQNDDNYKCHA